jgi:FkbM family methyltransferase
MTHILTSKNVEHKLPMDDTDVAAWFDNCNVTQTHHILRQINEERMFQPLLGSAEDYVILDLGANIGLFSLYAKDSAAKVIAVEPTPKTFGMLQKLTAGSPNIELLQGAASGVDGAVTFYVNDNPTINSLVNDVGEKVTVDAFTIDSIMKKFSVDYIDFVKCDIEGGEMVALTGATIGAVADKVGFWAVETHQTNASTGAPWPGNLDSNRQELATIFQRHGYQTDFVGHDQLLAWK